MKSNHQHYLRFVKIPYSLEKADVISYAQDRKKGDNLIMRQGRHTSCAVHSLYQYIKFKQITSKHFSSLSQGKSVMDK